MILFACNNFVNRRKFRIRNLGLRMHPHYHSCYIFNLGSMNVWWLSLWMVRNHVGFLIFYSFHTQILWRCFSTQWNPLCVCCFIIFPHNSVKFMLFKHNIMHRVVSGYTWECEHLFFKNLQNSEQIFECSLIWSIWNKINDKNPNTKLLFIHYFKWNIFYFMRTDSGAWK